MDASRLRLAPFPADDDAPYLRLLHRAVKERGVDVLELGSVAETARRVQVDVVHLHWLEYLVSGGAVRSAARGLRLARALRRLRRSGTRIVWTVHNLHPHERRHPFVEELVARAAVRNADSLIVHSRYAAGKVAETYGAGHKVAVIPHGNFVGLYPPAARSRAETRAELGIPADAFTYLVFGQMRRYKRIPQAIRAFRSLRDPDLRLLLAGAARDDVLRAEIEAAARGDPRVLQQFEHVPDERVVELHEAADACVLPYRQVFSSGALLLALSLGLPAVAPAEGSAEVAGPPALERVDDDDLAGALLAVRGGDQAERRRAAHAAAARFAWGPIAERTLALYERPPVASRWD
jgi:glycosyltransferase involved in cell wall biosynthesis